MMRQIAWIADRIPTFLYVLAVGAIAYAFGRAVGGPTEHGAASSPIAEGSGAGEHDGHEHTAGAVEYVCPMHPQIRRDEPGTCPICFMDLVPVETGGGAGGADVLAPSEAAVALARVRTEPVARVPLTRELRVFGRVGTADSGEANITAWTDGRIERLFVDTVGQTVTRGQRLARIYSPELVVAQETLIHARRILADAQASGSESRAAAAEAAEAAARTELRLLGIPDAQIDALVGDGVADETVQIHSPASGTVLRRFVLEGDHVERGTPLLALADLGEVWVQLEVYERDLPLVTVGTPVRLRIPGVSGEPIDGTVAFVDPVLDPERRVTRARVVVANDAGELRPDMFVEGTITASVVDDGGHPPVSVPASAVLWTGVRSVVYVYDPVESPPVYMPIEVEVGPRVGDRVVITSGVFPGEEVVINGAFRLDAALQIRGGATMMNPSGDDAGGGGHEH